MGAVLIPSDSPPRVTGCDYYNRPTSPKEVGRPLWMLIDSMRIKLQPIISKFSPGLNLYNHHDVLKKIKTLKRALQAAPTEELRQQLNILEDWNKVLMLKEIRISDDQPLAYCTLAEATGGVTKKVSLITLTTAMGQLRLLDKAKISTLAEYSDQHDNFKLSTEAILKLPKYGNPLEVQHEEMALHMARILGLNATKSTMVDYEGKPALFVPFDNIHLLSDVATGKTKQARLFSSAKYSHYSTINPVGSGLQANRIVEDFGKNLGFMYLSNDPDALGGKNQNKGLLGKIFYIFDQVFTLRNIFKLDSRLSMQPVHLLGKHTRHAQGRNRTLVEDSSIETKLASLLQLKEKQGELVAYCMDVANGHAEKIRTLKQARDQERKPQTLKNLKKQINLLEILMRDALKMSKKVEERIKKIDGILPTYAVYDTDGNKLIKKELNTENKQIFEKALILEKMFNKPKLFADDGRPFRFPWTQRNKNRVLSIEAVKDKPDLIRIKFGGAISADVIAMLIRQGISSLKKSSSRELELSMEDFKKLDEAMLFSEPQAGSVAGKNYIHPDDLKVIKEGYGKGHRGRIMKAIEEYRVMMDMNEPQIAKLNRMHAVEQKLNTYINGNKVLGIAPPVDKGFGKHVLKQFHFDMQQRLQAMMTPIPAKINKAFQAALRLDRVSEFNAVVREAVMQNKFNSPEFGLFLDECVSSDDKTVDHFSAKEQSAELVHSAERAINKLKTPEVGPNLASGRRDAQLYRGTLEGFKRGDEPDNTVESSSDASRARTTSHRPGPTS